MKIPKYRVRRDRDLAYVEMNGRRISLPGRANSPESVDAYRRLLNEYLREHSAAGRAPGPRPLEGMTVGAVVEAWMDHRRAFYSASNTRSSDYSNSLYAVRPLVALYEDCRVVDFRADEMKALRQAMITGRWSHREMKQKVRPWSRSHTNGAIGRIKRMFKWGLEHGLVPAENAAMIAAVPPLEKGRTFARETEPIRPADDAVVDATLPHLPAVVQAMVAVHRLTGMRSDNLCAMRPMDIDRSGEVWVYRPGAHKGSHLDLDLAVLLGPKCQAILLPYLDRPADAPCFCPREASRRSTGQRAPGLRYTTGTYRNAVRRACKKAKVAIWHPHQLRHTAANAAKKARGVEGARAFLGHSLVSTTEIYEERDLALAVAIAREIG